MGCRCADQAEVVLEAALSLLGLEFAVVSELVSPRLRSGGGARLAVEPAGVALDDEGVEDGRGLVPLLYVLVVLVPRGVS